MKVLVVGTLRITALGLIAALGACGGNTIPTGTSSTSAGASSTGAATTTTTTTTTGGVGSTGGSAGATSTGTTTTGGTGVAQSYPGSIATWGPAVGQIFPDWSLAGGALLNFATAPTTDSTADLTPLSDGGCAGAGDACNAFSFQELYDARAAGFRYAFIDISAVWCPHCNDEANTLPKQYVPGWLAQGGIVFSILVEGATPGIPATQTDLTNWVNQYKINYPMSLDAQENMVGGTGLNAWPANLIIRLSDMTVMDSVFGATDAFYSEFSAQLTACQTSSDCWSGATCTSNQCH